MKDRSGKTVKLGDYVIAMEGISQQPIVGRVCLIDTSPFISGEAVPAVQLTLRNGRKSDWTYTSDEIRKLRVEELI